ncbi:MAG TPA: hypothetical protein VLF68_05170 [Candidatus Saccharimonadales bacterium]|nr:hypothetical protein [Candidatus Saccharimonadales bacterium]
MAEVNTAPSPADTGKNFSSGFRSRHRARPTPRQSAATLAQPETQAPPETINTERIDTEVQQVTNSVLNQSFQESDSAWQALPEDQRNEQANQNSPLATMRYVGLVSELPIVDSRNGKSYAQPVDTLGLSVSSGGNVYRVASIVSGDEASFQCRVETATGQKVVPLSRNDVMQGLIVTEQAKILEYFPQGSPQRQLVETYIQTLDPAQRDEVLANPATREIVAAAAEVSGAPTTRDFAQFIDSFNLIPEGGLSDAQKAQRAVQREEGRRVLQEIEAGGGSVVSAEEAIRVIQALGCNAETLPQTVVQAEARIPDLISQAQRPNATEADARNLREAQELVKLLKTMNADAFSDDGPIYKGFSDLIEGKLPVKDANNMRNAIRSGKPEEFVGALIDQAEKKGVKNLSKKDIQMLLSEGGIGLGALFWLYTYLMQQMGGTQQQR